MLPPLSLTLAKYDEHDHYVKFIIQDINVMNEARHLIEEKGWYDECSLNKKLLRIPLDCFTEICLEDEAISELFSAEAKKKISKIANSDSGVFKPYAGVSTAILVFTKTGNGGTDKVWFYDMKADGYSLDDKRQQISENDIPDIINRFNHLDQEMERKRTDQSFMVDLADIVANDYDLSINKYKETVYVAKEYPPTEEIIKEIENIEVQIQNELAELKKLLLK